MKHNFITLKRNYETKELEFEHRTGDGADRERGNGLTVPVENSFWHYSADHFSKNEAVELLRDAQIKFHENLIEEIRNAKLT